VKPSEMEVSMEAAAVLLSLAMRDTESPVSELCGALRRIAQTANGSSVTNDVSVCIQSLQFHDRLIQQLAAVRGLLASVVSDAPMNMSGFGAHRWDELLRMLRERLSEDSQHHLFALLLRTGIVDTDGQRNLQAEEGSVELF
jgi:hypothetical protein